MTVKCGLEGEERFLPCGKWKRNIPGIEDSLHDGPQA